SPISHSAPSQYSDMSGSGNGEANEDPNLLRLCIKDVNAMQSEPESEPKFIKGFPIQIQAFNDIMAVGDRRWCLKARLNCYQFE
ncbi:hypothetical protein PFISCL1PPCAC_21053, partial [Pristionchus fissidentatus]